MDIHQFEPLWGSWYLREVIGAGSYGVIYRAEQKIIDRVHENAVKHISIPKDEADLWGIKNALCMTNTSDVKQYLDETLHDILNEYNNLQQFADYPNFVQVHDVLSIPKEDMPGYDIFIRMELLNNISTIFDPDHTHEREVIHLGIDICTALVEMHKQNLIHRDIKPQNILVSNRGVYKLADLGSVRKLSGTSTAMTMRGTFDYTAPEVLTGAPSDSRVDIYSMGIVMYQLLNRNILPTYRMPGDHLVLPQSVSPELAKVVLKACEFYQDKRWHSAEEMLDALQNLEKTGKAGKDVFSIETIVETLEENKTTGADVSSNVQVQSASAETHAANDDKTSKTSIADNNRLYQYTYEPENTIAFGEWGSCNWFIDNNGTLVITEGTGTDTDYEIQLPPWSKHTKAIRAVKTVGCVNAPKTCKALFRNLINCEKMDLKSFNTSNSIDMSFMFAHCTKLSSLDLSSFDTVNVTNMRAMFITCTNLSALNLNFFSTSIVTDMAFMFCDCKSLIALNIGSFNTKIVIDMSYMFKGCSNITHLDTSNFLTSNVANMSFMFSGCSHISSLDLSSFRITHYTDIQCLLSDCFSLHTLILGPKNYNVSTETQLTGTWKSSQSEIRFEGKSLLRNHPQGTTATYTKISN